MTGVIYMIRCVHTDKVYIGSALYPRVRKGAHFSNLKFGKHHSIHLQRSYDKHGRDAFSFHIVETVEDVAFLRPREQFWLWRYAGRLYNSSDSARGATGAAWTPERKAAHSEKMKGNTRRLGAKASDEEREEKRIQMIGNRYRSGIPHPKEMKQQIGASLARAYAEGRRMAPAGISEPLRSGRERYRQMLKDGTARHPRHDPDRIKAICDMYHAVGPKRTAESFGVTQGSVCELVKKYRPEIMKRKRKCG